MSLKKDEILNIFSGKVCTEEVVEKSGVDWTNEAILLPLPLKKNCSGVMLFKVEEGLLEIPFNKIVEEHAVKLSTDEAALVDEDRLKRIYSAIIGVIENCLRNGAEKDAAMFIQYYERLNLLTADYDFKVKELILENDTIPVDIKGLEELKKVISKISEQFFVSLYIIDENKMVYPFAINGASVVEKGDLGIVSFESMFSSNPNMEIEFKLSDLNEMNIKLFRREDVIQLIFNNVLILGSYEYHDYHIKINNGQICIEFDDEAAKEENGLTGPTIDATGSKYLN